MPWAAAEHGAQLQLRRCETGHVLPHVSQQVAIMTAQPWQVGQVPGVCCVHLAQALQMPSQLFPEAMKSVHDHFTTTRSKKRL